MASILRLPFRLSRQFQLRSWLPLFQRPAPPVREFTPSIFPVLDPTKKLEEEKLDWYSPDEFYPVRIGDMFRSRYQVIGKLGYGGYSTVWLCKDLKKHAYVTLKVFERNSSEGQRETEAFNHLKSVGVVKHAGSRLVRTALDSFQITSAEGNYGCLVHPPLGMDFGEFRRMFRANVLPEQLVKLTLIHVLYAVDYLHTEAGIVHTDIQERNIMMGIEDTSLLTDFEEEEKISPSPRKFVGDRATYASRKFKYTRNHGRPTLCDFGQARFGSKTNTYSGLIQPAIYRAPEVVLEMPWNEKADIWSLGVLTWELFQRGHLFYGREPGEPLEKRTDAYHLAEMIAIMGPPPKEMIQNSEYATEFFDSEGNWKGTVEIPSVSMEKLEGHLEGEPQQLFLQFMRKMIRWKPEERESASSLLEDPWLHSP